MSTVLEQAILLEHNRDRPERLLSASGSPRKKCFHHRYSGPIYARLLCDSPLSFTRFHYPDRTRVYRFPQSPFYGDLHF